MGMFVGVDGGCGSHAVRVIDAKGQVLDRFEAGDDREGLAARIPRLTKHGQPGDIANAIEHTIAERQDGRIVTSFPRTGRICAAPILAPILAEIGDVRERFQSADQLAAEAGVAPVTYQSGKSRGVGWRWACNKRLRAAITCFADNSRHQSPWPA